MRRFMAMSKSLASAMKRQEMLQSVDILQAYWWHYCIHPSHNGDFDAIFNSHFGSSWCWWNGGMLL